MRRLLLLVGAIVFVDTMFYAALTPLLPQYADDLDLSKAGAGCSRLRARRARRRDSRRPVGREVRRPPDGAGPGCSAWPSTTVFGFAESIVVLDLARFFQGFASSFSCRRARLARRRRPARPRRRDDRRGHGRGDRRGAVRARARRRGVDRRHGPAFASVGVLAAVLAVWAWRTPAFRPETPQPLRRLFEAAVDPRVAASIWFVVLPAFLFGTLNVLGPLRLDVLGLSALAIGATWLVAATFEALITPAVGRVSDRRGRLAPLRAGLLGGAVTTALLPVIEHGWLLAAVIVVAACAYSSFWAPAMSMLADRAEELGLDYAYGFALINLAWAPGAPPAPRSGAVARATTDGVVYGALAALCVVTLVTLTPRLREPAPASR